MRRKQSPFHDKWHPRVEGQIRDCIHAHPRWFSCGSEDDKKHLINSLAKRIVGELAAGFCLVDSAASDAVSVAEIAAGEDGGINLPLPGADTGPLASGIGTVTPHFNDQLRAQLKSLREHMINHVLNHVPFGPSTPIRNHVGPDDFLPD